MENIGVSLFLTTYNWPKALSLCMQSVFSQSVLPDEVIIADDGSGDDTRKMVESLYKDSPFPIKHIWQEDKGYRINHIRNLAIKNARYPYIIQLDGDVVLDKNFIKDHKAFAKQGQFIAGRRSDLSLSTTQKLILDNHLGDLPHLFRNRFIAVVHKLLFGSGSLFKSVRGCNMAYWKSDAYAVNGYDEEMNSKGPNDKEFAARLINSGVKCYDLKFYACCHHLFHGEEGLCTNYEEVKSILDDTVHSRKVKCNVGLMHIS